MYCWKLVQVVFNGKSLWSYRLKFIFKNRHKGLISWAGTAFEYLMPNINIRKYPGSLLDESCKFLIMSQREYSKRL